MKNLPIYNFVILGKSGAGKSSLINYFFDKQVSKVGQGKPVTGKEFDKYNLKESNLEINIYDSWGIEAGKTNEWTNYLKQFISSRKSENISSWIHTAVYSISAESTRLEVFEKEIINILIEEELNPIIVVTKSDLDSKFLKSIKNEYPKLSVVPVCNVEMQVGLGSVKKVSKQFGIEKLKQQVLLSILKSFEKRFMFIVEEINNNAINNAIILLEKEVDEVLNNYRTNLIGNISHHKLIKIEEDIVTKINSYNQKIEDKIVNMYNEAVQIYGGFSKVNLPAFNSIRESFKLERVLFDNFMGKFMHSILELSEEGIINLSTFHFLLFTTTIGEGLRLKGVDKQDLKRLIMEKIDEYYSELSIQFILREDDKYAC